MRFVIGNGANIRVWTEGWLRDGRCPAISAMTRDNADLRVSALIDPVHNHWRVDLLHQLFPLEDVHSIINTPLYKEVEEDRRVWRYDKRGAYTVKSAYRLCMTIAEHNNEWRVAGDWDALWKLKVPPKIRVFLWR